MSKRWFENSVGYQIYPSSFCDSNNDGIGDLNGIKTKLFYLKNLGVDILWICPFLKSPQIDNGYDISDHYMVDERYGNLQDLVALIAEAQQLNIKIIMDLVLNHTSNQHSWFLEEVNYLKKHPAIIENVEKTTYIWKKAQYDKFHNVLLPNNWGSFFGTSAWEYVEELDSFYLHVFDKTMPDLNFKNPHVREKLHAVAKFYLDMGIKGFRLDAISHLAKDDSYANSSLPVNAEGFVCDPSVFSNKAAVYDYLKEFKEVVFDHYDILVIGEVGGNADCETALRYANKENGSMNMVFNFDCCWSNNLYDNEDMDNVSVNVVNLKENFNRWYMALNNQAYQAIYWLNHDHPRLMSQYGDHDYYEMSAKMLGGILYLQKGLPFIYNGEEIGMCNVDYQTINDFIEPTTLAYYEEAIKKRDIAVVLNYIKKAFKDNARNPMQWSKHDAYYSKMQRKVNHDINKISVDSEAEDNNSILSFYKDLLKLRKAKPELFVEGTMEFIEINDPKLFIFKRTFNTQKCFVIGNFSYTENTYILSEKIHEIWIKNYVDCLIENNKIKLRPYEFLVIACE